MHVKVSIVLLKILDGNLHDSFPNLVVDGITVLELQGRLVRTLSVFRVHKFSLMRAVLVGFLCLL